MRMPLGGMNNVGPMGGRMPMGGMQNRPQNPAQRQAGPISYAGAVKQESKEPKFAPQQNKQGPQQAPPKKKLRLEQMGFGNMGAGFGCSQFTPNQGEEMPTMLHMGYDGEGFGDDPAGEVKTEVKMGATSKESAPKLGKMGKVGDMKAVDTGEKSEWPPSLMDYISRAFSSCRNDQEKDKTESYLKDLLNGRLKSGSAYEIDWESEPLPKDIFVDKGKISYEKNTQRDIMYDSAQRDADLLQSMRSMANNPRKMTKAEKKAKKRGAVAGLTSAEAQNYQVVDPMEGVKRAARNMRFQSEMKKEMQKRQMPLQLTLGGGFEAPKTFDPSKAKIIGTNTQTFKPYLRLTCAPEPWEVRTGAQLKKSFKAVLAKWKDENKYKWTCEQLKSIRQDLTVQCIRDEFMVEVYETHARIAIEAQDHAEFNQCQSQLAMLYKDGKKSNNKAEFAAYSIIYCLYTKNMTDMTKRLSQLTEDMANEQIISDALKLRSHLCLGNYLAFFRIYKRSSPHMKMLVGKFIERERRKAICTIVKGFRPSFPVSDIAEQLAFDDEKEALQFLTENKLTIKDGDVDCKESVDVVPSIRATIKAD